MQQPLDYADIFNTDLLQSPSSARSSPAPATPFDSLAEPSMFAASDFFNFMDSNEMMQKPGSSSTDPFGLSGFDFANALSTFSPSAQQQLPSPAETMDPASMLGTPSTVSLDDFDSPSSEEPVIAPVKAGGHGKGARKGTVQTGGVTKTRSAPVKKLSLSPGPSAASLSPMPQSTKENDMDDDDLPADWRPAPEVLAKMSPKEKRQLRNKISARNFRVRRKEYITTLEGDISERDKLLSAIRAELGSSQSENNALRAEIAALKRALLTGQSPLPALLQSNIAAAPPSPAPLPASDVDMKQQVTPPSSPLIKPNYHKDLPIAGPSKGFWGASSPHTAAGFTPVHRMVLPEVDLERAFHSQEGENINPLINNRQVSTERAEEPAKGGFDQWSESHLFNLKNMDAYRMQLWQQMALRQQQQQQQNPSTTVAVSNPKLTGLAAGVRPHFFLGGLGRSAPSTLPPPATGKQPLSSSFSANAPKMTMTDDAYLAHLASQTLVRRLSSAFWDAFSGREDGVQKVLEGKAVLRVVDVDQSPPTMPTPKPMMKPRMNTAPVRAASVPSPATCASDRNECQLAMSKLLEDSMRSLTLVSKK